MRIMTCVEWLYAGKWEFSGAFTEPEEAAKHYTSLLDEFPDDHMRIVTKKVSVDEEVIKELPRPVVV